MNASFPARANAPDAPFMYLLFSGFALLGTGLLTATGFIPIWCLFVPAVFYALLVVLCASNLSSSSWRYAWQGSSLVAGIIGLIVAFLLSSWWTLLPGGLAIVAVFCLNLNTQALPKGAEATLWGWMMVFPALLGLIVWHFAPAVYAFVRQGWHHVGRLADEAALGFDPGFV